MHIYIYKLVNLYLICAFKKSFYLLKKLKYLRKYLSR